MSETTNGTSTGNGTSSVGGVPALFGRAETLLGGIRARLRGRAREPHGSADYGD